MDGCVCVCVGLMREGARHSVSWERLWEIREGMSVRQPLALRICG